MNSLKYLIARLPNWAQDDIKRLYYSWQIKKDAFKTDEPEYKYLKHILSSGEWVIDIGANIGHYTKLLSDIVGPEGRVFSFEPIPNTFYHLTANAKKFKYQNITLINAAVSSNSSVVAMSMPAFKSGLKNYYQASIVNDKKDTDILVFSISIDHLEFNHKIALIKIDAEGHEPMVMDGLKKVLERDSPVLIIETVTDQMRNNLILLGYKEKVMPNSPNTIFFQ